MPYDRCIIIIIFQLSVIRTLVKTMSYRRYRHWCQTRVRESCSSGTTMKSTASVCPASDAGTPRDFYCIFYTRCMLTPYVHTIHGRVTCHGSSRSPEWTIPEAGSNARLCSRPDRKTDKKVLCAAYSARSHTLILVPFRTVTRAGMTAAVAVVFNFTINSHV